MLSFRFSRLSLSVSCFETRSRLLLSKFWTRIFLYHRVWNGTEIFSFESHVSRQDRGEINLIFTRIFRDREISWCSDGWMGGMCISLKYKLVFFIKTSLEFLGISLVNMILYFKPLLSFCLLLHIFISSYPHILCIAFVVRGNFGDVDARRR